MTSLPQPNQAPQLAPPQPPLNPPPKVGKSTFIYKSDLRKNQFDKQPCSGILHGLRLSTSANGGREEQSFSWIANFALVDVAINHLEQYGFTRENMQFIPYSSKSNWINKYPHAFPYVDCDVLGNVSGFPHWSPHAQNALDIPPEVVSVAIQPSMSAAVARSATVMGKATPAGLAASYKKKGGAGLPNTILANNERNALHNEIHNYFSWLADQVTEMETTDAGRRGLAKAGLTSTSLQGLVLKLESTFKNVGPQKKTADGRAGQSPYPLLEESLVNEMTILASADHQVQKKLRAKLKEEASERKRQAHWEPLDFEVMFAKLVAFKDEHGHPNVPVKYQQDIQLGGWVSGLRTKKKAYDKAGGDAANEWALGNEEGGAEGPPPLNPGITSKYLTAERVRRLDEIGFAWSMARPKAKPKSWDERLSDLQEYYQENGNFKVPRNCGLGEWVHNQRTLYGKRDTRFMSKKAPRMEAIGYKFDIRDSVAVSWNDRFQQLQEYHATYGTYDVQAPVSSDGAGTGLNPQEMEQFRFAKWVTRLHNEYRAYEKGTHSKLNAERVERLRSINFEFKGPSRRGRPTAAGNTNNHIPGIPFEKRIQQLESFQHDTGHLNIDHNYKHCSNLGGWAAEISDMYKQWKAGDQEVSPEMVNRFNQLSAMGFQFNVMGYYECNRNWDDQYVMLTEYKNRYGNARVPLKYKADLRLGKWVQSQRQQYKLYSEGKKSKLDPVRVQKLEALGFDWQLAPGPMNDEPMMEQYQVQHEVEVPVAAEVMGVPHQEV